MRHWGIKNIVIGLLVTVTAVLAPAAGASPATAATAPATTVASAPIVSQMVLRTLAETAVILVTNTKRAIAGCPPLKLNRDLRTAARRHSYEMGRAGVLSHQVSGESTLGRRVTAAGYTRWRKVAENIAVGFPTSRAVVRAWWNSTAHRRNIADCSLREIGVGVVSYGGRLWWTQNFGRR
ncbi:MAG: CAP domain-containing protein [Propionibacteriales bacterium]|nr:CAP domain-containing protein [Propionibacteriales bacterium]